MTDRPAAVPEPAVGQPVRADARRNRARVLQAAQAAFATEGFSVPLDEIARRAGVGAGTVYRHFPSKEALFEAVVDDRLERILDDAHALTAAEDPGAAFFAFFSDMVERVSFNKALAAALEASTGVQMRRRPTMQRAFRAAVATLLTRAQRAGKVREDVDAADVVALAVGCITMEQRRGSPGRMVAIVCAALRPGQAELPSVVTKPHPAGANRNETEGTCHGTTATSDPPRCEVCGDLIRRGRTGRPARFCGAACRQKAHRRARAGGTHRRGTLGRTGGTDEFPDPTLSQP